MEKVIKVKKVRSPVRQADFDEFDAEIHTMHDLFGSDTPNKSLVRFGYDENCLYIKVRAYYSGKLPEKYKRKSGKVYRSDCVEVFFSVYGDLQRYYELDVSPYNRTFLSKVNNETEWEVESTPLDRTFIQTKTNVETGYYDVAYFLPFQKFICKNDHYKSVEIRLNVYRVELLNGKRISRSMIPTNSQSHHVKKSFVKIALI